MTDLVISGGRVLLGDRLAPGSLAIAGERITSVTSVTPTAGVDGSAPMIDADGLIVAPGFVDIQINGGFGIDLLSESSGMWELARRLPSQGVTSFLPTIITAPTERVEAALAAWRARPAGHVGADPVGLHLEGPMLSPARPGAHPPAHLRAPSPEVIARWSAANGVRLVTLAPELAGAGSVIAELVDRGVVVSAGHTEADAAEARAAISAGVTLVTHLFNAMAPLGHRAPNLVGVALTDPGLAASMIVDGIHVDPDVVALAWRALGPDGLVLITDAVAPMGCEPGEFDFAGSITASEDGSVRMADGTLAGSTLTMDLAVRNLVRFTGCRPEHALRSAAATPAGIIGAGGRGSIDVGSVADIVLLDDDLHVVATICRGHLAHVADEMRHRLPPGLAAPGSGRDREGRE